MLGKLCTRAARETEGTVFPNMDLPVRKKGKFLPYGITLKATFGSNFHYSRSFQIWCTRAFTFWVQKAILLAKLFDSVLNVCILRCFTGKQKA